MSGIATRAIAQQRNAACRSFFGDFVAKQHRPPSLSEIQRGLRLPSKTAAARVMARLKRAGSTTNH